MLFPTGFSEWYLSDQAWTQNIPSYDCVMVFPMESACLSTCWYISQKMMQPMEDCSRACGSFFGGSPHVSFFLSDSLCVIFPMCGCAWRFFHCLENGGSMGWGISGKKVLTSMGAHAIRDAAVKIPQEWPATSACLEWNLWCVLVLLMVRNATVCFPCRESGSRLLL